MLSRGARTAFYRGAFVALAVAVGYLALTPAPSPDLSVGWDKANHALAFAALAFAADKGFGSKRGHRVVGALGLLGYGAAIEVAQYFLPPRSCDWHDLVADAAGIAVGIGVSLAVGTLGRAFAEPTSRD